eukprot:1718744-Karenia_brevis.AAC.1
MALIAQIGAMQKTSMTLLASHHSRRVSRQRGRDGVISSTVQPLWNELFAVLIRNKWYKWGQLT